jgi:hypothetical protein
MDIFNKKKIEDLNLAIESLLEIEKRKDERIKKLEEIIFGSCCGISLPESSLLSFIANDIKAIKEYLKVEVLWHWEDDPNYPPVEQPQIRVWRAEKRRSK